MAKISRWEMNCVNGAEIVVRAFESHGVDTVFGYPGGSVLSVYDELSRSSIKHILTSHEQFACHAADGYARATGKVGVVIATSGPGATNLVTGIANAYMDSIPLIALTGNVKLPLLGHDAFQEIDIAGVTMPITKHNFIVKSVDELAEILCRAFRIALSGRKGPVLVDVPSDIFDTEAAQCDVTPLPLRHTDIDPDEIDSAVNAVESAERPFICAGGGVIASGASERLNKLAQTLDCPVAVTAMGKGAFPSSDNKYVGVVGAGITDRAKDALARCDLFIAVGTRFSEKLLANVAEYAPDAKILHMDIDAAETGKNADYCSRIVGDIDETLSLLLPRISKKASAKLTIATHQNGFFGILNDIAADCIITTEVGSHQLAAVNAVERELPRSFITSGGLGTMGFGLPAAIGAALGTGKTCVNIAGDGCFNMNMQELMTAAKYSLPITQIVIRNRKLGMIEQWQNDKYGGRLYQTTLPDVDYSLIARGMGVVSYEPQSDEEFAASLKTSVTSGLPALIIMDTDL